MRNYRQSARSKLRAIFFVLATLVCASCSAREAAHETTDVRLPSLIRVSIPGLDSIGPERTVTRVAISRQGRIAFTNVFNQQDELITIIDTSGRIVRRLGRRGQGPGEFGRLAFLAFGGDDESLLVLDQSRLVRYDSVGEYVGMSVIAQLGIPTRLTPDTIDIVDASFLPRMRFNSYWRVHLTLTNLWLRHDPQNNPPSGSCTTLFVASSGGLEFQVRAHEGVGSNPAVGSHTGWMRKWVADSQTVLREGAERLVLPSETQLSGPNKFRFYSGILPGTWEATGRYAVDHNTPMFLTCNLVGVSFPPPPPP